MTEGGGKVAPVTGRGRRIGAAIPRAFAKAGHTVVLTYRGSSREGRSPAARIGEAAVTLDLPRRRRSDGSGIGRVGGRIAGRGRPGRLAVRARGEI